MGEVNPIQIQECLRTLEEVRRELASLEKQEIEYLRTVGQSYRRDEALKVEEALISAGYEVEDAIRHLQM